MTMEEKDRMLNKYKYGLDHGGRIMNSEEAEKIRKNKKKLSVGIEVLNDSIDMSPVVIEKTMDVDDGEYVLFLERIIDVCERKIKNSII